jgi:hypothetical protein
LKRIWSLDELLDHFTLQTDEMALLRHTTDRNRLGFAVLLKCFQYEGRFPQRPQDVPEDIIHYMADQLAIPAEVYTQYDWQGRSIKMHRARIRDFLDFHPYAEVDGQALIAWLMTEALPHDQQAESLTEKACQRLRALKIEPPTSAQLDRLVRAAISRYDDALFERIGSRLSAETRQRLDALLEPALSEDSTETDYTQLYEIKQDAGAVGVNSLQKVANRLARLKALNLPASLFADVMPKAIARYRQRAAVAAPSFLQRHPASIRYTLLAAFCWCRQREITDELVELLIQIVHKIGVRAERKVYKELLADLMRVSGKTTLLFKIAEAAVENPDGTIRDVLFPVVSEAKLKDLVREYQSDGPAYKLRVHRTMRGSYGRHYRQMLPALPANAAGTAGCAGLSHAQHRQQGSDPRRETAAQVHRQWAALLPARRGGAAQRGGAARPT